MAKTTRKTSGSVERSVERSVTELTFRKRLPEIFKRVRGGKERFVIKKDGAVQGIFLGAEEYSRLSRAVVPELDAMRREAQTNGLARWTLRDINREIQQHRRERRQKLAKT